MKIIPYFLLFVSSANAYISFKFCVNCKHFLPHKTNERFGKCRAFPTEKTSFYLVTGKMEIEPTDHRYCSAARHLENLCGQRAVRYEDMDDCKRLAATPLPARPPHLCGRGNHHEGIDE